MSETITKLSNIPKGGKLYISPPAIQALMTGVQYISVQRDGITTLHYEDGTSEKAWLGRKYFEPIPDNYFGIVGDVQDANKHCKKDNKSN